MIQEDTISAVTTAPGNAAIGIIRISGPEALKKLPALRHMMTCQSHNDLTRRIFLLIERGKIQELQKEIPALTELRTARFAEL